MPSQRYSVTPHPIEILLTWVKSGRAAIPEIQRPFVWDATKVRNLLDSLCLGYPVGYPIAWRNPSVRLKDGTPWRQGIIQENPYADSGSIARTLEAVKGIVNNHVGVIDLAVAPEFLSPGTAWRQDPPRTH